MTVPLKLNIIRDVEDRVKDESKTALLVKSHFQRELAALSQSMRDVRYSDLLLDEAVETRQTVEKRLKAAIAPLEAEVKRIYDFRVLNERKNAMYQTGGSMLPVHSDIIGNLLILTPGLKNSLERFANRALPAYLRREVWKALLFNQTAEVDYSYQMVHDRMRTVSKNEVEITRRSQELLSDFCPAQALNYEIISWVKAVLSYLENKLDRKLPDNMFYLVLPLAYVMTDNARYLPALVGYTLSIYDIQTSVWIPSGDLSLCDFFMQVMDDTDPEVAALIRSLLDLRLEERRLTEFVSAFIGRLTCGFFAIECSCLIYDQMIIKNTMHYLVDVLAVVLGWMKDRLKKAVDFDHFEETFKRRCRRLRVRQLEELLGLVVRRDLVDSEVAVPPDLLGEDYVRFVNEKPADRHSNADAQSHLMERKLSRGTVGSNMMGHQTDPQRKKAGKTLMNLDIRQTTQQLLDTYMSDKASNLLKDSKDFLQQPPAHRRNPSDTGRDQRGSLGITPWSKGANPVAEKYQIMGGAVPFLDLSALGSDLLEDLDNSAQ